MNSEKKNQLLIIGVVLGLIILISGGTYAYLTWVTSNTQETAVTFTVKENFSCSADGGGNIIETDVDIVPTTCDDTRGRVIKRKVTTTASLNGTSVVMDLWLNINKLGTGLSNSTNFMYKLTKGEDCNSQTVASGSFNGKTVGDTVNLLNGVLFEETESKEYYLWIWLDAAEEDKSTQNQLFDLSLGGECTQVDSTAPIKAIYSEDDNSLRFYNGNNLPSTLSTGDTYNDLTVTAIYTPPTIYDSDWSKEYGEVITTIVVEDMIFPTSLIYWFKDLLYVTNMDVTKLNTSKVVKMNYAFYKTGYNVESFNIDGLDNWDTSNVAYMNSMFASAGHNATIWNIGNLSKWDMSKVTTTAEMFKNAGNYVSVFDIGNLKNWNLSSATVMTSMFQGAGYNATNFELDLSNWDTSNVAYMNSMFASAGSHSTTFNLDLSGWKTSNVLNMEKMFQEAGRGAITWDINGISDWNTSKVRNMSHMFQYAGQNSTTFSLEDISKWNISSVTNMDSMFYYAGYTATGWSLNLSSWDVSKVTSYSSFNYGVESKITPPVWVN